MPKEKTTALTLSTSAPEQPQSTSTLSCTQRGIQIRFLPSSLGSQPAHWRTCLRPSPHSSPGASLTTLHHCTQLGRFNYELGKLGPRVSNSASSCGVNSVSSILRSLHDRSSHGSLPTCLQVGLETLLTCTSVTSRSLCTRRPSHAGGSAWFISCAFWICLQMAGVRLE